MNISIVAFEQKLSNLIFLWFCHSPPYKQYDLGDYKDLADAMIENLSHPAWKFIPKEVQKIIQDSNLF
jgi:hypothetical protein